MHGILQCSLRLVTLANMGGCSGYCGGGHRNRFRRACCHEKTDHWNAEAAYKCVKDCGLDRSDMYDYSACSKNCYHGGTFHCDHSDIESHKTDYGHCICSRKYGGPCCDTRTYNYR